MKYILIIALSVGMLHAMGLKIEQVYKYEDSDSYYALLKDGREISTSKNQKGEIRCMVIRTWDHDYIEEDGDREWYPVLKREYEKKQQSVSQEK